MGSIPDTSPTGVRSVKGISSWDASAPDDVPDAFTKRDDAHPVVSSFVDPSAVLEEGKPSGPQY
jgi:hypothetical protein